MSASLGASFEGVDGAAFEDLLRIHRLLDAPEAGAELCRQHDGARADGPLQTELVRLLVDDELAATQIEPRRPRGFGLRHGPAEELHLEDRSELAVACALHADDLLVVFLPVE